MTQQSPSSKPPLAKTGAHVLERLSIWPHRSLSPKGFVILMSILGGLLFTIGLGFFLAGAWPVIGFLGLELLIVWGAFKLNYRAAQKRETIETTADTVTVKRTDVNGKTSATKFPLGWIKVRLTPATVPESSSRQAQRVLLSSHGVETEIGHFLHPAEKPALQREVNHLLDRSKAQRDAD